MLQNQHKECDKFWLEHSKVSKIYPLMGCFWPKYIMFQLRKYRAVIYNDTENQWKLWKGIDLSVQSWHKECEKFWLEHLKISEMCFWPKYVMFELRKYRGVISDGTEDWWKIWRKTDLCFQNW